MRYLIITTSKIGSTQLAELQKHYSLLTITKHHLSKSINQLGVSELIIFNLEFGVFANPQHSDRLKWLVAQDLSQFHTVFVYGKSKFKNVFGKANLYVKSLPVIVGRSLPQVLSLTERMDKRSGSISLTADELRVITEEINESKQRIEIDDVIQLLEHYKQIEIQYNELKNQKQREPLPKRADNIEQEPEQEPEQEQEQEPEQEPVKRELIHITRGIKLVQNGILIDTLTYRSRNELREVRRQAMSWLKN
jgi:hypothetical protein